MRIMAEARGYDGVLNMYKPQGWTSCQVVEQVKRLTPAGKVGHGGTLDPSATGVLPVCVGRATKIVPYLLDSTKTYVATMRLGIVTDTQDSTGRTVEEAAIVEVRDDRLEGAFSQLRGVSLQMPPMYSALRHGGERLYALARRGVSVERKARKITVHNLTLLGRSDRDVTFRITCSRGTYVRTMCHDLGRFLGCGAHLRLLERIRVGPFGIESTLLFERLRSVVNAGGLHQVLVPMYDALAFLPAVELREEGVGPVLRGMPIARRFVRNLSGEIGKGAIVRVRSGEGRLLAVAEAVGGPDEQAVAPGEAVLFRLRRVLAA